VKFEIKNRWTGNAQYSCELDAEFAGKSISIQLGAAVKMGYKSRAVLSDADLSGADLSRAYLSGADLSGAVLSGADLSGAVVSGAVLSDADLSGVPKIPQIHRAIFEAASKQIHRAIFEAASKQAALGTGIWHGACDTTHCRAGLVIALAGDAGKAMEFCMGTPAAAALIYLASDPKIEKIPDFYASNEVSLADMKRLAELEDEK
jgi:hypothetical protein